MGLKLSIIASAAILVPAAAGAQAAAQDQAAQPAAGAAAQQADTKAQADTKVQADTGDKAAAASVKVATKADVKAGASVYDPNGKLVGKIDSVDGKSAVLNTGKVQVKIPLASIARDEKGLAIGMSKAEIEAAASKK
jgi:hypothetical protein